MDNRRGKYIGLNQRIPIEVLDVAIHGYLEKGFLDKEYIFQQVQKFTPGENRAHKVLKYITQIIVQQRYFLDMFRKIVVNTPYFSFNKENRKAFCLCMISLTYPIMYDTLIFLAQGLKVQNYISKKFINQKVMSIYGSNRTVDIAIDALIPMLIELGTINRFKVGIYTSGLTLTITDKFIYELVIYTDIKLSGSKSMLLEDMTSKPLYVYFDISSMSVDYFHFLIARQDSAPGISYLTILPPL
ncbi:MAG: hypothetical protein SF053_13340 [Bacteroidia bacterium]|nr:hypothetical protein [Bacteroidia bacterium]